MVKVLSFVAHKWHIAVFALGCRHLLVEILTESGEEIVDRWELVRKSVLLLLFLLFRTCCLWDLVFLVTFLVEVGDALFQSLVVTFEAACVDKLLVLLDH